MNEKISIDFKMTDENKKILDELTKPVRIRHFLIETEFGDKFDVVEYPEYQKLQQENQQLKSKLKEVIDYINTTKYSDIVGLNSSSIKDFWFVKEILEILNIDKGDE